MGRIVCFAKVERLASDSLQTGGNRRSCDQNLKVNTVYMDGFKQ